MTRTWLRGSSLRHRKGLTRRTGLRLGPSIRYDPVDRLFSKWIRRRDKVCQYCGRGDRRLEAAHMFGRGRKSVRYDPENVYAMCGGPSSATCHHWLDTHETEKQAWLKARLGEQRYGLLAVRARTPAKPDLVAIRLWLETELRRI